MLLLVSVVVLPLVLKSSPPDERATPADVSLESPAESPDRIRITRLAGPNPLDPGMESTREAGTPPDPDAPAPDDAPARDAPAPDAPAPDATAGGGSGEVPVSGWAVQIGSFADPRNARRLHDHVAARGFRVLTQRVTSPEGRLRLRVLVGPDRTRAAAAESLSRLRRDESLDGFVVRYPG